MKKGTTARIASAKAGGPSTDRGVDYHIGYAVLQALESIALFFHQPLRRPFLAIEPRLLHTENATNWDILTGPPLRVIEAKVNLSKLDLLQFLQRAGETPGNSTLELCFGGCRTMLLTPAKRLRGLAIGCGRHVDRFNEAVRREQIPDGPIVLDALGVSYFDRLKRIRFQNYPEEVLARELKFRAEQLFPAQPDRLIDFLHRKFLGGAAHRQKYEISPLVDEIEQAGIPLIRPPEVRLDELPSAIVGALAMLQAAQHGLPEEVLVASTGAPIEQLREEIVRTGLAALDGKLWRSKPAPYRIFVERREDLLCECFRNLLNHLRDHETVPGIEASLRSAIALAQQCLELRPGQALSFFQATEHVIKNLGDKHLLLEVSELCIRAGQRSDAGDGDTRARALAQAWLCGRSWVFQRTNRLPEARLWAEKSLELGEKIGWERNTAFANKCIGRLERLEAEQPTDGPGTKLKLLKESTTKLRRAIEMFSTLREFGPASS